MESHVEVTAMSDLKGKTVYDSSGREYTFDHEHEGKAFCYPLHEFQDGSGEWFEMPSDSLVALYKVYRAAPVGKLAEQVKDLTRQIEEAKVRQAELRGETSAINSAYNQERRAYERFMEEFGVINRLGKLMAGEPVVIIEVQTHEWTVPVAGGVREIPALKLLYDQKKKAWRFAKPRAGSGTGYTTLELFDTVEDADAFVTALFDNLCKKVAIRAQNNSMDVYSPSAAYTTPHISALRKWVDKWPHLAIPQEILDGELECLQKLRDAEVAKALARIEELQKG